MAAFGEDLCDLIEPLGLDDRQKKLREISKDHDSCIFWWDIKRLTGVSQNLIISLVDKLRDKISTCNYDEFYLSRFCWQLIICYELYVSGQYSDSLKEVESIIKFLESCKFEESQKQFSNLYGHIARTTYAYITSTLSLDSEMIINIEPANNLSQAQKAAICALKARIFIEYPPKGTFIALKFAEQARNLDPSDPEHIYIWLKTKMQVKSHEWNSMPDIDELNATELICSYKTTSYLTLASSVYSEAALRFKHKRMREESNKYYKLASDLISEVIDFENENNNSMKLLCSCLLVYVRLPLEFHSEPVIKYIIKKLSDCNYFSAHQGLGKYYSKYTKDYEKAKFHLSQAMASGHFDSSMLLVRVECKLQSVNKYPLLDKLNMIYDKFPSPQRRLIVLAQILMYYYFYYENNQKEIMHYLKLYLDEDIDDVYKKRYLTFAYPLFKDVYFNTKSFLDQLHLKIKKFKNSYSWTTEEKQTIEDTFDNFVKISNVCIDDNKTDVRKHNDKNNDLYRQKQLNCKLPSTNIDHNDGTAIKSSWRHQQDRSQNPSQCVRGGINWRPRKLNK